MQKVEETTVFKDSPLLTFSTFEDEKRRASGLPYLRRMQFTVDELVVPGERPASAPNSDASITDLAQKHNYTVTYYLKLLGRSEMEADAQREREKEEERLREEERNRTMQSRDAAKRAQEPKASKAPPPPEKVVEKQRPASRQLDPSADPRNRVTKRTIAAMLEARIDQYRQDPDMRDRLSHEVSRIRSRKHENTSRKDLVELNKTAFKTMTRDSMMDEIHQRMQAMNLHIEHVVAHRQQLEEQEYQRKLKVMNRKELQEAERRRQIAAEQARVRQQERQKKWLVLLALAARQGLMLYRVKQARVEREVNKVKIQAAIKIQRCWRLHQRIVQGRIWRKRMFIVHRTLRRCILHFRIERKRKSADLVQMFLLDLQDVKHIVQVVKRFRFQVKRSQMFWRNYQQIQNAEMTLLRMQWDSIETQLLLERKSKVDNEARNQKIMENALNYVAASKKKKGVNPSPPSRANRRFSISKPHTPGPPRPITDLVPVPEAIKTRLLSENVKQRRKSYALALEAYREELRRWEEVERSHAKVRASYEAARRQLSDSSYAVAAFENTFGPLPESYRGAPAADAKRPSTQLAKSANRPMIVQPTLPPNPKPQHPGVFVLLLPSDEVLDLIEVGQREMHAEVSREPSQLALPPAGSQQLQVQRSIPPASENGSLRRGSVPPRGRSPEKTPSANRLPEKNPSSSRLPAVK